MCKEIKIGLFYKIFIFITGVAPATCWFLLGSYWSFGLFNNIVNIPLWLLFYSFALFGVLGFWLELLKPDKYKALISIGMILGCIVTCVIYFTEPNMFRELFLAVFSPVVAGIVILIKNAHNKFVHRT
ncbi:hypothetical protein ACJJH9_15720 [Microbulbifer sp. DLAB2-AF]|uniref:hypothetical protein n=1 Tax=Microbulbifer sp. DLAB2-AF TaxID=3243395 RepID=UPI004039E564